MTTKTRVISILLNFVMKEQLILFSKCNVDSTTEHAIFSCYFSKYFIHALALFLDNMYNDGKPEFIFLKVGLGRISGRAGYPAGYPAIFNIRPDTGY